MMKQPVILFLSYAHEDEALCKELEKHLSLLQQQRIITPWRDRQIYPGANWAEVIDEQLDKASIILLLISANFLASNYCYGIEMKHALERHKVGQARVIPIIIRFCDWSHAPFAHLQGLPMDMRPIMNWPDRDEAWTEVATGIRRIIELQNNVFASHFHHSHDNREVMLERVHDTWITKVLEHSLHEKLFIELGLKQPPDVLENPWRLWVQETDQLATSLPAGTSIIDVYDRSKKSLLILGAPGAGKTTLLLSLTRTLLERANQREHEPMPVFFHLSTWGERQLPLEEWLVVEMQVRYGILPTIGTTWVKNEQLILLLDGLDEVAPGARMNCVKAINQYQKQFPFVSLVVCSRYQDFLDLSVRFRLNMAVLIQPFTNAQIDEYLTPFGEKVQGLRDVLDEDKELRELASTPLMLSILALAYEGQQHDTISGKQSTGEAQEQVFAAYMDKMLNRRGKHKKYSSQKTMRWLVILAKQMQHQNQTLFSLEQMQTTWLSNESLHHLYTSGAIRTPGILQGVLISLIFSCWLFTPSIPISSLILTSFILIGGFLGCLLSRTPKKQVSIAPPKNIFKHRFFARGMVALSVGLITGIIAMLDWRVFDSGILVQSTGAGIVGCIGLLLALFVEPKTSLFNTNRYVSRKLAFRTILQSAPVRDGILIGGITTLIVMLGYGLYTILSGQELWNRTTLTGIPGVALIVGFPVGLLSALLSFLLADRSGKIEVVELLTWTRQSIWQSLKSKEHLKNVLLFGLFLIIIAVSLTSLILWGSSIVPDQKTLVTGFILMFSIVISVTVTYWVLFGLFRGVSGGQLDAKKRVVPNQGIHRSAWNGLLFGVIGGSICLVACLLSIAFAFICYFVLSICINITGSSAIPSTSSLVGSQSTTSFFLSILPVVLVFASASCLTIGLQIGWLACLRHYLLRCLLWFNGSIPWNYVQFLDYAVERLLLQKAGGGYIFIHRLLLDYLASLDISSPDQKIPAKSARKNFSSVIPQNPITHQKNTISPSVSKKNISHKTGIIIFLEVMLLLFLTCGVVFFGVNQQHISNVAASTASANSDEATVSAYAATTTNSHNAFPVAYPPTNISPALNDPLRDNNQGNSWEAYNPESGSCRFTNQNYDIITYESERCLARTTNFTNFIYEVQMKIIQGSGGIVFRIDPADGYASYSFVINQNGAYYLTDNSIQATLTQGFSSAIHRGLLQANLIAVVAYRTIIELYVNHQLVAVVHGDTFITHGEIGVIVEGSPTGQGEVLFQNAKVWNL